MPADLPPALPRRRAGSSAGAFFRFDRETFQTVLLCTIAVILLVAALSQARIIAVPTVLAILCAVALAPLSRRMERLGAPATLAAAVIVAGLLAGSASTLYALAPSAEAWNARAPQVLREMERRVRQISSEVSRSVGIDGGDDATGATTGGAAQPAAPATPAPARDEAPEGDTVDRLVEGGQRLLADVAIGTPQLAAAAAFWAMLTFFLLRDRVMLARSMMRLSAASSTRRAIGRAMRDVRTDVAGYLLAITAVNVGLGLCTALAFRLLGVDNAFLWGVAFALLNFMPFIGAAIMALVMLGVGIVSFADPVVAFAPLAVVLVLNAIEGQVVTPMVVGARLRLPAIAVFFAIAFGAWLWGAAGALVATPALIVAAAFLRRLTAAPVRRSGAARQHERREERRKREQ